MWLFFSVVSLCAALAMIFVDIVVVCCADAYLVLIVVCLSDISHVIIPIYVNKSQFILH